MNEPEEQQAPFRPTERAVGAAPEEVLFFLDVSLTVGHNESGSYQVNFGVSNTVLVDGH